ncbi:MAG: hypothetical protein ACXVIJ_08760 [Thermoanaerobaculia bacterium]
MNHGESEDLGSYVVTPGIVWKGPFRMEVGPGVPVSIRGERSRSKVLKLTREFDMQ